MGIVAINKIGRNDPCSCGSGKKYKKCCFLKDQVEPILGVNYLGETVRINKEKQDRLTEEINLIPMRRLLGNENLTLDDLAKPEKKQFKKMHFLDAIDTLEELYTTYDESIDDLDGGLSCKAGCSSCCTMYVDVSPIEAKYIREYILDNFTEDEVQKLHKKVKRNISTSPDFETVVKDDSMKGKYHFKQIPCAFLDESGSCSIYKARPFSCRKYGVISDPKLCNDPHSKEPIRANLQTNAGMEMAIIKLNLSVYNEEFIRSKDNERLFYFKHISQWFSIKDFEEIS